MIIVNKSLLSLVNGQLVGEASTMGLKPGEWPTHISVVNDAGNGYLFMRGQADRSHGELHGFNYVAQDGTRMLVVND